jgi:hypothetical protein
MALPDSYTLKPGSIPAYFDAMLNAEPPTRFTQSFLEGLEFKSTNDRLFIGVLKDLGFIDQDGAPQERYYQFLDRSQSARVVAAGIREAYADLFAVNKQAETLSAEDVRNKLRTLYKGAKGDNVITRIASTFSALCEYADFSAAAKPATAQGLEDKQPPDTSGAALPTTTQNTGENKRSPVVSPSAGSLSLDALQYHINIVLPDTRDQSVYDAIFKSLRDHLGPKQ